LTSLPSGRYPYAVIKGRLLAGIVAVMALAAAGTWLVTRCPDRTTFAPERGLPASLHGKAADLLVAGELPGQGRPDRGLCPLIRRCHDIVRSWQPADPRSAELRAAELATLEEFDHYRKERDAIVAEARQLSPTNVRLAKLRHDWDEYETAERVKLVSLLKKVDLLALSLPVR